MICFVNIIFQLYILLDFFIFLSYSSFPSKNFISYRFSAFSTKKFYFLRKKLAFYRFSGLSTKNFHFLRKKIAIYHFISFPGVSISFSTIFFGFPAFHFAFYCFRFLSAGYFRFPPDQIAYRHSNLLLGSHVYPFGRPFRDCTSWTFDFSHAMDYDKVWQACRGRINSPEANRHDSLEN